jgi:hypothetical protein
MPNLLALALKVLNKEGPVCLFRKSIVFLRTQICSHEIFYLMVHEITALDVNQYLPRIPDYEIRFLSAPKDAFDMLTYGYDIYSRPFFNTLERLTAGAVAFCVLIDKDVAHVGWIALSEEAKKTIDPNPFVVDFRHREACTGGTMTLPKYEGLGLMTFGYFKRIEYLYNNGFRFFRSSVGIKNTASLKVHAKFNAHIYAVLHHYTVIGMSFWRKVENQEFRT